MSKPWWIFPLFVAVTGTVAWLLAGPPPPLAAAFIGFMLGVSITLHLALRWLAHPRP